MARVNAKSPNSSHSNGNDEVKINISMKTFVPRQAIIYNYFQILKEHGFINDVTVYKDKNRYRIGICSLMPSPTDLKEI